ncbi:MAG: TetR/AcrR family transcriptional regulator [Hyphomicrobiales bacterium]|nr:TetR/AcrR family transcriptional regulator [Hyphomicrobiales bacterium]MCP5372808.1 TetR/AcrR family transcriptional regulator [Hyphomicrobiales bacterium]
MNSISKGEHTRAAIVGAALDQVAARGLNGISIGGLAERTGMSKSGLFGHFGSKESLQQAVLEALVAEFSEAVVLPALRLDDGIARMQALFEGFLRWAGDARRPGGCPFYALSLELGGQPGPHRDYLFDQHRQWREIIARVAAKCVAEGRFRGDLDIQGFAFEVQGLDLAFNYAAHIIGDPKAETLARQAFARLLRDAQP